MQVATKEKLKLVPGTFQSALSFGQEGVDLKSAGEVCATEATFAEMLAFSNKLKAAPQTGNTDLPQMFAEKLAAASVVSFDIFDTLLIRYLEHPSEVFLYLEQEPAFAAHTFREAIAKLRVEAEDAARKLVFKLIQSYEANLLEIYQVFCDLNGLDRSYAEGFVAAEESVELRLCMAHPLLLPLHQQALESGKRIIFVSDMYHGREFLERLLKHCGIEPEPGSVFVSSEIRKSKSSGMLFPEVLLQLGVVPGAVLHIGDHPVSDLQAASVAGIPAILHPYKASSERPNLIAASLRSGTQGLAATDRSMLSGMRRAASLTASGHAQDFWWNFGYSAVGPLTVGFCQWLEASLRNDGMEHAYFLLRDGELFYKVYGELFADDSEACKASLLPASRRAMLLPALELNLQFALPSLLGGIGARPVREFLDRLQVDASLFREEALAAGFFSLEERVDARMADSRLARFLLSPRVLGALLVRGKMEREALRMFLEQHGVLLCGKAAVVDLGWSGTIQKSLHVLLQNLSPSTAVTGYYLATLGEADHSRVAGVSTRSYLAERGNPAHIVNHIYSFLNLFEQVYTSATGSLLYFSTENGQAVPNYQQPDRSTAQAERLHRMHEGALACARDYKKLAQSFGVPALPVDVAAEEFLRIIARPTAEEAAQLGTLEHCDNLGSSSMHASIGLDGSGDLERLLQSYQECHWKQGALAMNTPESAVLRNVLWMGEQFPR